MPSIDKDTAFRVFNLEETPRHSSTKYGDVWSLIDRPLDEVKLIRLPPTASHHSKDVGCVTFLLLLKEELEVKVGRRTTTLAPYQYLLANPKHVIRAYNRSAQAPAEFIWTRYPLDMCYRPISRKPQARHRR